VGQVGVAPGLFNVVPGACELWVEVRHVDAARLQEMALEVTRRFRDIADQRGTFVAIEEVSRQEPEALAANMVERADRLAREQGIRFRRMASGAAHDAMVFARAGIPALMLFVQSRHGVSHAPEEFTEPEALHAGYRFAVELVRRLTRDVPARG